MKVWTYIACFILISLISEVAVQAQTPHFKTLVLPTDLESIKLLNFYESPTGPLWLGSSHGLLSYDGTEFKTYFRSDGGIETVTAIYMDKHSILWAGYEDGSIFKLKDGVFKNWQPEEGLPKVRITGFTEDSYGNTWYSTYGEGLYCVNGPRIYNFNKEDGLPAEDIYVLKSDQKGNVIAGTDGGFSFCSFSNREKNVINITTNDGLPDEIVQEILVDEKDNLWIATYDHGFCYYNTSSKRFEFPIADWKDGNIQNLEYFEGKELWIGTYNKGLLRFNLGDSTLESINTNTLQSSSKILDLHVDIEGNLWVLDNKSGLHMAHRPFESIKTPLNQIQALQYSNSGTLWIGTQNGLFTFNQNRDPSDNFRKYPFLDPCNIISLFEDSYGNIWIGTFGKGIYILHPSTRIILHLDSQHGLTNGSVLSLSGDENQLWIATLGGAFKINITENIFKNKNIEIFNYDSKSALGTNFIYSVYIDSKKRIWFGTDGSGLCKIENDRLESFTAISYTPFKESDSTINSTIKTVYSITEDSRGNIWFTTPKNGVFEYTGSKFNHLSVKEGIRDLEITGITADNKGNILIIHPKGIDLLNPENRHLIYYDREIGVEHFEPNLNVNTTDKEGNIWFAGSNNLYKYYSPNENLSIHPRIIFKNILVDYTPIYDYTFGKFKHNKNNFQFNFAGIWFTNPEKVKYRYMLEGYDPDWIHSKNQAAYYSNLKHGTYKFLVSASENEAFNEEPILSYEFKVAKPYWITPWFILISLAFVSSLFYIYIKIRDQRLQKVNLLEKERAKSQLAALKAQINPHFLFNSFNTLVALIEEDQDQAVKYVENMTDFYRAMMLYRDKDLIPLEEEINLVQNFDYLLKSRFGSNLHITYDLNGTTGSLPPLSIQMLVENAVKHNIISQDKPLEIHISTNQKGVKVRNNLQLKFKAEESTHFGLASLTQRYKLLGKDKIEIHKSEDAFEVFIPILKT